MTDLHIFHDRVGWSIQPKAYQDYGWVIKLLDDGSTELWEFHDGTSRMFIGAFISVHDALQAAKDLT